MPRFVLPTLNTHLRSVEAGTFLADIDIGEMFLNFILHKSVRVHAGVHLASHFPLAGGGTLWETWQWAAIGLKSSPYQACQAMGFAEEVIQRNRRDSKNVFPWDKVQMNLPGSSEYDPSLPWVSKVRKCDGRIAADAVTFVDDRHPLGPTSKDA
jgi:hypothetical protein